jgi:hypothetical protein
MTSSGPGTGKRGDWQPAGERLDQHEPECLGPARQHQDVRRRIVPHQRLALLTAGKNRRNTA